MKHKAFRKILIAVLAVFTIVIAASGIYIADYYHADDAAISAFAPDKGVTCAKIGDNAVVWSPENPVAGFAFYPGGKVEAGAYVPLMESCAERGILTVLFSMPGNLAVFDVDAVKSIAGEFGDIDRWFIGGHSLGGSMAASFVSEYAEYFDGLILLASYSTADLSNSPLKVLSIYGSEDGVLNGEKYDECRANLPADFREIVLDGANHAGFGMYGVQDGDGEAGISNAQQIVITAEAIAEFIK